MVGKFQFVPTQSTSFKMVETYLNQLKTLNPDPDPIPNPIAWENNWNLLGLKL